MLVPEGEGRRCRDRADPELECRAIRHELRDVLADPLLDEADGADPVFVGRDVDLDSEVDVVDVDEALAQCPRHRPVQLDDDGPGGSHRRMHRLDRVAEGAEAVVIWWRGVDQHGVERQCPRSEQAAGTSDRNTGT